MKKSLTKKIAAYSGAAGAFIAFAGNAEAQIVYTDVNPDVTLNVLNSDSYSIDFNNDATPEFILETYFSSTSSTYYSTKAIYTSFNAGIVPQGSFGIQGSGTFADVLNLNDSINSFQIFNTESYSYRYNLGYVSNGESPNGNFPSAGDKYIGVQFTIGTNTHYGWVLVNYAADCEFITVKGYAYESTPDKNILAGDVGQSGMSESNHQAFSVFPSLATNDIQIQVPTAGNIQIIDLSGKTLTSFDAEAGTQNVDISSLPSGMYFVKLSSANGVIEMTKIIVSK